MGSPPGFIRVFACTDVSAMSATALAYVQSLSRIAPVRVISMSPGGQLEGHWRAYGSLLMSPMSGTFVNVVACDPARWVWLQAVPMAKSTPSVAELAKAAAVPGTDDADPFDGIASGEVAKGLLELYTPSVRNVLIAIAPPRSRMQIETAKKYEAVIVPFGAPPAPWWLEPGLRVCTLRASDHASIRAVICP